MREALKIGRGLVLLAMVFVGSASIACAPYLIFGE